MIQIRYLSVAPLCDERMFSRFMEKVSPCRREKILALSSKTDRALSLGATLLLDDELQRRGLQEKEMQYGFSEHGKPCFSDLPDLHFSISHSGEMVAVAFCERPIGCDLEKIRPRNFKTAERFFAPTETDWLNALPKEQQNAAFLRLWTLKESYLKATGMGFALSLNAFSVEIKGEKITLHHPEKTAEYHFGEITDIPAYHLSYCVVGKPQEIQIEEKKF